MRRFLPAAAAFSGLLFAAPLPVLAAAAPAVAAPAAAAATAGPGADGPDLTSANRTAPAAGMPDWSRAGYRGGQSLPGNGDVTDDASCKITAGQLASTYKVIADDGADDTAGLQKAIDDIRSRCSPNANSHRLSLITLPSGRIDVSHQMYVDASFLIVRGQGSGDGGTRFVFRPDTDTRYDTLVNGRWDQNSMKAGSGSDVGTGGWIWPGRGMFRVQTRDVAERYKDDWAAAPANRKDIFEGSVNQHWASGIKVAAAPDDAAYAARQGQRTVHLDAKADMSKFSLGGYVWVGAANSVKFYEQQGVTDRSAMEDLHMRQQMFRVTATDGSARTITLDRPLEWDLPVDSESDGSAALSDKPYPSKVTPLQAVEGVGFEDFAFTQDMKGLPKLGGGTYDLSPEQAVHNYGNLAPEYAMHGIVFKWAANSWARGLKATMTGSHPIVTEDARNLQIERNSFDGAWNKGKGGNGYLRGSRVWDSLYAYNLSRNLRHFTFQWSASNNVAFRNDLDSDLNLHGGWEHNNLFEQNTLRVPYEHRSGNCAANCGGEGGEIDDGTWYPIWWAAGPKAVKWSGSSGPQNVFYNNTLIKQATEGGPYEPYEPYGTKPGTAFQFGSADDDPHQFKPLSQDGLPIADWTGRETQNFDGNGVVTRDEGKRPSLFLADTGGDVDPRDSNSRKVATWNMQGANTNQPNGNKYISELPRLSVSAGADILLLQEAGSPPASAQHLQDITGDNIQYWDDLGSPIPVREYRLGTASRPQYLYWLHTDTNQTSPPGRVNLAIWSRTRIDRDDVYVARSAFTSSRPALGINVDGVVYYTVHGLASSPGGNDDSLLLANIRDQMTPAGLPWIALGDYNRAPTTLQGNLGNTAVVHAPASATHPSSSTTLDYAVVPVLPATSPQPPTVAGISVVNTIQSSDHFPVLYELNGLPDPPPPAQAVAPALPTQTVVRNAATTQAAGPSQGDHAVSDQPVNQANLPAQTFSLSQDPEFPGYYRLFHQQQPYAGYYLGQEGGARDARTVLWQAEAADQLWAPAYQGDGTWLLENFVTHQFLTAPDGGGAVVGRDFSGEADQHWFLQNADQALKASEVVLQEETPAPLALEVDRPEEENSPVLLTTDEHQIEQRFSAIAAGRTGQDECYYLENEGRYANSTSGHPQEVRGGSTVTMNAFRPGDDGYLWCVTPDGQGEQYLSNHTTPDERIYLTPGSAPGGRVSVESGSPGASWSLT
ncbi:endonuclease/exonuclease/phosphatase family protein [Streptomyces longispororuber]|uniref:endonuclease/exonuclease/phosphatase family protein n=1 Tax=Streptomyces longispororuber TaxID=68230 RepID=UPI00210A91C0|nr:endonuclease/exonuclease/phosphatase family protein [Streptomyces longispororuber]MCQ4212814.1 endonuclease/exonuclease/phosphatase family protein [Streptomyces longispororuber]